MGNVAYHQDLLAAGYTRTEIHSWPVPEYRDEAGAVYYLTTDLAPWIGAEGCE